MAVEIARAEMVERIVPWTLNGAAQASFLCTPDALEELAVGHLLTQGLVARYEDIASVRVDGLSIAVEARLSGEPATLEARLEALRPVQARARLSMDEAVALMEALMGIEEYYGTHCLALRDPGGEVCFREDIGRHNAMDKVTGWGAARGVDFGACAVAATGRISLEMLTKAAAMGIPCVVSKKYPSDLSAETARRLGITIIGKALSGRPQVYADGSRT